MRTNSRRARGAVLRGAEVDRRMDRFVVRCLKVFGGVFAFAVVLTLVVG